MRHIMKRKMIGGVALNCVERLFNVAVVLLELSNCVHCYFCITILSCFYVRDREDFS